MEGLFCLQKQVQRFRKLSDWHIKSIYGRLFLAQFRGMGFIKYMKSWVSYLLPVCQRRNISAYKRRVDKNKLNEEWRRSPRRCVFLRKAFGTRGFVSPLADFCMMRKWILVFAKSCFVVMSYLHAFINQMDFVPKGNVFGFSMNVAQYAVVSMLPGSTLNNFDVTYSFALLMLKAIRNVKALLFQTLFCQLWSSAFQKLKIWYGSLKWEFVL